MMPVLTVRASARRSERDLISAGGSGTSMTSGAAKSVARTPTRAPAGDSLAIAATPTNTATRIPQSTVTANAVGCTATGGGTIPSPADNSIDSTVGFLGSAANQ